MPDDLLEPSPNDPFGPPAIPTEVGCLHCGEEYESYLIEWRVEPDANGRRRGWWCCPTAGCDGKGFGFDIFPTDPDYVSEDGTAMWTDDGDFDDDDEFDDEFDDDDDEFDDLPPLDGPRPPPMPRKPFSDDEDIPF